MNPSEPWRACRTDPKQPSENERKWANVSGKPGLAGSDEQGGIGDEGAVGGVEEAAQAVVLLLHCNRVGGDLHLDLAQSRTS